jgi:hypothetical protein
VRLCCSEVFPVFAGEIEFEKGPMKILLGFLIVCILFFGGQRLWRKAKQRSRGSWFSSQGHVETPTVVAITVESSSAQISYSYRIGDEIYGGCFQINCSDEQKAWDMPHLFQNQIVQIRINPRNPSKSSVVAFDRLGLNGGHYVR